VLKKSAVLMAMIRISCYAMAQEKPGNEIAVPPTEPKIAFQPQLVDTAALKNLNNLMKLQIATDSKQAFYSNMPVRILKKDDDMPNYQSRANDKMPVRKLKLVTKDSTKKQQ
jgi:hypothetical protein